MGYQTVVQMLPKCYLICYQWWYVVAKTSKVTASNR